MNVVDYLSNRTEISFKKSVIQTVLLDRGIAETTDAVMLEQKQKDLLLADLLFIAYTSPNSTASYSNSHGAWKQSVGSQTINGFGRYYNMMIQIYKKYGDEKLSLIPNASGCLTWVEFDD